MLQTLLMKTIVTVVMHTVKTQMIVFVVTIAVLVIIKMVKTQMKMLQ